MRLRRSPPDYSSREAAEGPPHGRGGACLQRQGRLEPRGQSAAGKTEGCEVALEEKSPLSATAAALGWFPLGEAGVSGALTQGRFLRNHRFFRA